MGSIQLYFGSLTGSCIESIPQNSYVDITIRISFEPEALHSIERLKSPQEDVVIHLDATYLYLRNTRLGSYLYRISLSDWLRFTTRWRGEAILVAISLDLKRMFDELMKDYRTRLISDSLSTVEKEEGTIASAS